MNITEFKTVTENRTVSIGYKCDCCGKFISGDMPDNWHEFEGHHESWGNDSIDSYKYYQVCSPKCYLKMLHEAIEHFEEYSTAIINGYSVEFLRELLKYCDIDE